MAYNVAQGSITNILNIADQTGQLSNWIGEKIDGKSIPGDFRNRTAAACFHISLSHHVAVASLLSTYRFASAFALLRPLMESYLRGMWLAKVATDHQIENLKNGTELPKSKQIAQALEDLGLCDKLILTNIVKDAWPVYCDFTHTGTRPIYTHMSETGISADIDVEMVNDFCIHCNMWAILSALGLCGLIGNENLTREIGSKGVEISKIYKAQQG